MPKARIVVVEDEPAIRRGVSDALRLSGYEVTEAADGAVGFGVDPQLQVARTLLDKARVTQGGNQVLTFKYRIAVTSYKKDPVTVQVWDRTPHAEAAMTIAVTVTNPKPDLSTDPLYVRDERPKGLLRWDTTVQPNQNGEKALPIEYEFKMELDKNVNIGGFLAK